MCLRRTGCSSFLPSPVLSLCSTAASTTILRESYIAHSSRLLLIPTLRDKLLEINERQRWVDPSQRGEWGNLSDEEKLIQDDQIFNTARLINCGHFAFAVFGDYLSSWVLAVCRPCLFSFSPRILGLVADLNPWSLNPFEEIRKKDHSVAERGRGNNISVEFNLLYRCASLPLVHARVS
jgi:hypothetical protein